MPDDPAPAAAGGARYTMPGRTVWRTATLARAGVDTEARTVELDFSSEYPVERWFGSEVLSHAPGAIRMDWIASGRAPLCVDHRLSDVIGVIESVSFDGAKGRARVRFGRSARAEEIMQDVADGIRTSVSVAYHIHEMELVERAGDAKTYRVTDWEPYEISIVSYPADPSVGVRDADTACPPITVRDVTMATDNPAPEAAPEAARTAPAAPAAPAPAPDATRSAAPAFDPTAERARIEAVRALGQKYGMADYAERAAAAGATAEEFMAVVTEQRADNAGNAALRPDTAVGLSGRDVQRYSLFRAVTAAASGDWSRAGLELEASRAVEASLGRPARGFYLPGEVLSQFGGAERAGELTTAAGGAPLVGTVHAAGSFIDLLRNRMVTGGLGVRTLSGLVGNVDIPRMTGGATAYWVTEGQDTTRSTSTYDTVTLSPRTVSGEVALTRRMTLQSSPEAEALVRDDLLMCLALGMDRAVLTGAGAADPLGVLNTPGVALVPLGTNGGAPSHGAIVDLETEIAAANADLGSLAYVTNARGRGKLKKTLVDAGTGRFLWERDELNGYRAVASNQVPGNLTKGTGTGLSAMLFGNWADVIIGEWGVLDIKVDHVTLGASGGLVLRAFHDADVAVRHAESFSVIKDMLTV